MMAAALAVLAAPALAAAPADPAARGPCFFHFQWDSWRSPDANTIYMRIKHDEYYRVDLSAGSNMLTDPTNHLISRVQGSSSVCSALDLNLDVTDGHITMPLIAKSIVKLTPEQVAAIPRKDLP
jgi:hypothetical protein